MRILKIRFKNLNSLAGEWEVDLCDPAYRTNGLFAITGPTGAGKSTLLDAVCLALYGCTPRLSRVNKSGNEIMSRRTGDCFAEVTFETQAGMFRCLWSQNRARKKPDGELQMPRHEIADARTGVLLETKIRDVADKIVEVTGMDFERFTRSMLLAQGAFAAFLQAAPEDRASILEQITGTDIYSVISMRVHERNNAEKKRLELLDAELGGIRVLTVEQLAELERGLAERDAVEKGQTARLDALALQAAWLEGLDRLDAEMLQLAERQQDLEARTAAFEPDRMRAQRAARALEAAAEGARLDSLRTAQAADDQLLVAARQALPAHEAACAAAETALMQKQAARDTARAEQQALQPRLHEARRLDVEIAERRGPLAEQERAGAAAEAERATLLETREQTQARHTLETGRLRTLEETLAATAADERLVARLAGMQAHLDHARTLARQQAERTGLLTEAEEARAACEEELGYKEAQCGAFCDRLAAGQTGLDAARRAVRETLGMLPAARWHERRQLLEAYLRHAEKAADLAADAAEEARRHESLSATAKTGARELLAARASLEAAETAREAGRLRVADLEEKLVLLRRIADLTEERNRLRDGVPCPLCGAEHHPYAVGNLPAADPVERELAEARERLHKISEEVETLRVQIGTLASVCARAEADLAACRAARVTLEERLHAAHAWLADSWEANAAPFPAVSDTGVADQQPAGAAEDASDGNTQFPSEQTINDLLNQTPMPRLPSPTLPPMGGLAADALAADALAADALVTDNSAMDDQAKNELALASLTVSGMENRAAALRSHATDCSGRLAALQARIGTGVSLEQDVLLLRDDTDRMRETLAAAELDARKAQQRLETARMDAERLLRERGVFAQECGKAVLALRAEVAAFMEMPASAVGQDAADETSRLLSWLESAMPQLEERSRQWQRNLAEKQACSQTLALLAQQLGQLAERIGQVEEALVRARQQAGSLRLALEGAEQARQLLFEGRSADLVEQAAAQAVEAAESAAATAIAVCQAARVEQEACLARIADREKTMAARAVQIGTVEAAWRVRLAALGFADEADWRDAMLPEAERRSLADRMQALAQEAHALADRTRTVAATRETERARRLTEETLPVLQQQRLEQAAARDSLQREIGAMRLLLEENRRQQQMLAERLAAREVQQAACARWSRLHELIGSADGKKYRNFAQGLTFEMMIRHANRQLARLSDRYLLARDASQPLELLVIDNYQAGEMRSTKNLSGGESFLVSLSLALGLSHMSSRKVRVDSLFLDEGFGTLDEETLATALDTLAGLERDGKLVGVISHVTGLKERIATQIQITPQANGRSTLAGNGVRRLD